MRVALLLSAILLSNTVRAQGIPSPPDSPAFARVLSAPAPPEAPTVAPGPPSPSLPLAIRLMSADRQSVQAAVEDYLLGFYEAAPERLERSLHPDLQKVGFWRNDEGAYQYTEMRYEQALSLSARWNADGRQTTEDSPRDIELLEVNDQTAVAKLTAVWGVDYFHLGKYDGTWKIINVIWQSHPPSEGN